ncbi:MAG: hypothetical protein JXA21_21255 [Anaerolineae bacterium]|nr:hypothetical protein [Anaerolineae bacterium]
MSRRCRSHAQGVVSGTRIYGQDVNCANPQSPEVSLPYEDLTNGYWSIGKTFYLCVDGYGSINLTLHAEVLGYGSGTQASLKCLSGCTEFEDITQPEEIVWERGNCKHRLRREKTTVAVEPGKYKLVVSAGYFGTFYVDVHAKHLHPDPGRQPRLHVQPDRDVDRHER